MDVHHHHKFMVQYTSNHIKSETLPVFWRKVVTQMITRPDSVVLDVGGWIGATALWLAAVARKASATNGWVAGLQVYCDFAW